MGIFKRTRDLSAGPTDLGIASPWSPGFSSQVILSDLFGTELAESLPMTRQEALKVPSVSRALNLLQSTICRFPLKALDANGVLVSQPTWLYRTDGPETPYERLAFTISDLVFYGRSLWVVERGAAGQIIRADWCPTDRWTITEGRVLVDEQPIPEVNYLFFNHAFDGLLTVANDTLRGARALDKTWVSKARNPIPLTVIRQVNDGSTAALEQDEITDLLAQWQAARRSPDGALGFLPQGLELETHGEMDPAFMENGRNALRTDIANFLAIPVALLDGSLAQASLTYVTTEGNQNRLYAETVPYWTTAIEARLSMDDCVPRGQRVRFDLSEAYALTPTPTSAPAED